ncbi:hypothetical protein SEA_JUSTBECAUSE_259 [Streptomyces phage JustBecause]|nr:hypothetical protein SEA_JUSTBECAUSE_259 [Streptomyces phage JustBecause]
MAETQNGLPVREPGKALKEAREAEEQGR